MLFRRAKNVDWIIVGLGNPGDRYAMTRHNVGFRVTERLEDRLGLRCSRARFHAMVGQGSHAGQQILLMRPQTFMNLSGEAVAEAAQFYKVPPERCLIIFDDISLPPGRLRIRRDGSAGGHNGIKSIIAQLGSQAFPRVKVGVGDKPHPDYDLADWVLSTFSAQEQKLLEPALDRAAGAALEIVAHGVEQAANEYNGK